MFPEFSMLERLRELYDRRRTAPTNRDLPMLVTAYRRDLIEDATPAIIHAASLMSDKDYSLFVDAVSRELLLTMKRIRERERPMT